MFRLMLSLFFAALLLGALSAPSYAQRFCGERGEILKTLEKTHSETPRAIGLSEDGGLLEILVSPAGGWTILITYPKRPTCVVAVGESWESTIAVEIGDPA